MYLYVAHNKLPYSKATIWTLETLAEIYILLHSMLFKLIPPEKETTLLAIPETCADKIISLYDSCLFAEHQSVN